MAAWRARPGHGPSRRAGPIIDGFSRQREASRCDDAEIDVPIRLLLWRKVGEQIITRENPAWRFCCAKVSAQPFRVMR